MVSFRGRETIESCYSHTTWLALDTAQTLAKLALGGCQLRERSGQVFHLIVKLLFDSAQLLGRETVEVYGFLPARHDRSSRRRGIGLLKLTQTGSWPMMKTV